MLKSLKTKLTQTGVIGIVNEFCKGDSIVVGAAEACPQTCSAMDPAMNRFLPYGIWLLLHGI